MRVSITCESCGYKHRLERESIEPGSIWIICHGCELPLQATLDPKALKKPVSAWDGVLDFEPSSSQNS